jgi:hypothetical protein
MFPTAMDPGAVHQALESLGDPDICNGPASRVRFLGPSTIGGEAVYNELILAGKNIRTHISSTLSRKRAYLS